MNRIEEKMNQLKAQGKKAFITPTTAGGLLTVSGTTTTRACSSRSRRWLRR